MVAGEPVSGEVAWGGVSSILVTGGAGFIGSHFVRRLLARSNCRVVNLDALMSDSMGRA